MVDSFGELARRSRNFGFLLRHEPLLVVDGAAAETYIYSDPGAGHGQGALSRTVRACAWLRQASGGALMLLLP